MWLVKELARHLAVRADHCLKCLLLDGIRSVRHGETDVGLNRRKNCKFLEFKLLKTNQIFTHRRMKHIDRVHRRRARLLASKHQVDPFVQLRPYGVRFERLSMDEDKQTRGSRCPGGQFDVIDAFTRLATAKAKVFVVLEHLGQCEEFGNDLFDVGRRVATGQAPCGVHRVERAVRQIETVVLVA